MAGGKFISPIGYLPELEDNTEMTPGMVTSPDKGSLMKGLTKLTCMSSLVVMVTERSELTEHSKMRILTPASP